MPALGTLGGATTNTYNPNRSCIPYAGPIAAAVNDTDKESIITDYRTNHGEGRILVVALGCSASSEAQTRASVVTYNGVSLVRATFVTASNSQFARSELWFLLNPPVGSYSLAVGMEESNINRVTINMLACSFYNVKPSPPYDVSSAVNTLTGNSDINYPITWGSSNSLLISGITYSTFSGGFSANTLLGTTAGGCSTGLSSRLTNIDGATNNVGWSFNPIGPSESVASTAMIFTNKCY